MKSFSKFLEEEVAANATAQGGVAGTGPGEVADWTYNKGKRKRKPLTRHYIEVNGKIKKTSKKMY
jgi:hypothetical protein